MLKKNIILVCLMFLVLFSFTGCGSSEQVEPDINTIMSQINSQIAFPEMVEISTDRVSDYYEVDTSTIEESQLIIAGSGATPEEILLIKFSDSAQAEAFESKINNRLNQITSLFTNYGSPESADHIENSKIEVKNQYAFFAICENSDLALKLFNESF